MSRRLAPSLAAALVVATLGASDARADLPPPEGTKFVGFSFKVENLAQAKDFVLLAYPCSQSSGVPVRKMAVIQDGAVVDVGRRGGDCKLYAMARADFDAWRKGTPGDEGDAVDALFTGGAVRACTGGPEVKATLPTSDSRDRILQGLRVAKLDATGCSITGASAPATPASATPPTETPPGKSGCAGCSVDGSPLGPGSMAGLLAMVALAARRRRT
jgi:MYXO-CTERM domain-containing protein